MLDFLIANWYWALLLVVSGVLLAFPELFGGAGTQGLNLNEAILKINREKAVLIDIREPAERTTETIAQAKYLSLDELEEKIPKLVKNKTLPVLFICHSGVRSVRAAKQARKLGYENSHSVSGGILAWKKANMPVVATSKQDATA